MSLLPVRWGNFGQSICRGLVEGTRSGRVAEHGLLQGWWRGGGACNTRSIRYEQPVVTKGRSCRRFMPHAPSAVSLSPRGNQGTALRGNQCTSVGVFALASRFDRKQSIRGVGEMGVVGGRRYRRCSRRASSLTPQSLKET